MCTLTSGQNFPPHKWYIQPKYPIKRVIFFAGIEFDDIFFVIPSFKHQNIFGHESVTSQACFSLLNLHRILLFVHQKCTQVAISWGGLDVLPFFEMIVLHIHLNLQIYLPTDNMIRFDRVKISPIKLRKKQNLCFLFVIIPHYTSKNVYVVKEFLTILIQFIPTSSVCKRIWKCIINIFLPNKIPKKK